MIANPFDFIPAPVTLYHWTNLARTRSPETPSRQHGRCVAPTQDACDSFSATRVAWPRFRSGELAYIIQDELARDLQGPHKLLDSERLPYEWEQNTAYVLVQGYDSLCYEYEYRSIVRQLAGFVFTSCSIDRETWDQIAQ